MAKVKTFEIEWKSALLKDFADVAGVDSSGPVIESRSVAAPHTVLAESRKRNGFTLLNLLRGYRGMSESERALIYDRLAALIPPPPGVSRDSIVRGNNDIVGLWWDLMGVGHPKNK